MTNRLLELKRYGQSIWLDFIRRGLITSGELQRLIDDDGLAGLTANPSIFEKAIAESDDYDEVIARMSARSAGEVYEALAFEDVQMAAALFAPLYEKTRGDDGYVSIEIPASLARNTEGSIREARRYHDTVNRPNVLVKIPATEEGIPAIEESLADGISINITLIFSIERYLQVHEAYLRALERRVEQGQPIHHLASVASFFVSRVDSLADKLIEKKLSETSDPAMQEQLRSLLGKVAIANSKVAYRRFKEVCNSERFARLQQHGARVQRVLWASTSTKNPKYPDTYYVDELIGPHTVNTLPPETLKLFREHGKVRPSLEENVGEAQAILDRLAEVGISRAAIAQQLEAEGAKAFDDAYKKLLQVIEQRTEEHRARLEPVR